MAKMTLFKILLGSAPVLAAGDAGSFASTNMIRLRTGGQVAVGESVVIGTSLSMDCCSVYNSFGVMYLNTYRMLLDWITEQRGGIRVDGPDRPPRPLELVAFNDYSSLSKVREIYTQLTGPMGLQLLLAPYGSDITEGAADVANRSGALLVAPGAALTSVFKGRPNVFGTFTPSTEYLVAPFEVMGPKARSVSYLFENVAFTKSVCSRVPSLAQAYNLTLKHTMPIPQEANSRVVQEVVGNLTRNPPDIVIACVYNNVCHNFIREMKAQKLEPMATLFTICVTDPALVNLGELGTFHTGTTPWLPSFVQLRDEATNLTAFNFADNYQKRFSASPPYHAASAWAALLALVDSIEAARSTSVANVSAQLRSLKKKTLYGEVSFDSNRQCKNPFKGVQLFDPQPPLAVKVVSPKAAAEADMVIPMPTWQERECLSRSASISGYFNGTCQPCPGGYIAKWVANLSRSLCVACPSGTSPGFNASEGKVTCLDCAPGRFGAYGAQQECEACPPGSFSNTFGKKICDFCEPGHSAVDAGMSACTQCGPGTAMPDFGAVLCQRCNRSLFMPGFGALECQQCPEGLTTAGLGSNTEAECVCANGYFPTKSGSQTVCSDCPEGLSCDWDAVDQASVMTKPQLLPQYWSSQDEPLSVYRCGSERSCPGGAAGTCAEFLKGIACGQCEDEFVLVRGQCVPCNSMEKSGALYPALPLVGGPIAVALVYWRSRDGAAKWGNWKNGLSSMGFVALKHYQILGLIMGSNVMMPKVVGDVFVAWSYVLELTDFLRPGCSSQPGFKSGFLVRITLPLMALALFALTWVLTQVVGAMGASNLRMDANILFSVYMSVLQAFYVFVASVSLKLFMCYNHPNGRSSLVAAPQVLCGSDDWTQMFGVSVAAIIVYVAGLTAVVTYIICVAPNHFANVAFQRRWKFLFIRFKPSVWWWSLPMMMQGLCLNLTNVAFQDGVMQCSSIILITLVYAATLVSVYPWRHNCANILDKVTCGSILFITAVALMYTRTSPQGELWAPYLMVAMSFIPMIFGVCVTIALLVIGLSPSTERRRLAAREKVAAALRKGLAVFVEAPPENVAQLLRRMADHDFAILEQARMVIMAELLGKQASSLRWSQRLISETANARASQLAEAKDLEKCMQEDDEEEISDPDLLTAMAFAKAESTVPGVFQCVRVRV